MLKNSLKLFLVQFPSGIQEYFKNNNGTKTELSAGQICEMDNYVSNNFILISHANIYKRNGCWQL